MKIYVDGASKPAHKTLRIHRAEKDKERDRGIIGLHCCVLYDTDRVHAIILDHFVSRCIPVHALLCVTPSFMTWRFRDCITVRSCYCTACNVYRICIDWIALLIVFVLTGLQCLSSIINFIDRIEPLLLLCREC